MVHGCPNRITHWVDRDFGTGIALEFGICDQHPEFDVTPSRDDDD